MATYKEKVGTAVQNIAGEDGVVTGQLWYDSSDSEFKYKYQAYGNAWSSQALQNTHREGGTGSNSAAAYTAALTYGGAINPGAVQALTESWNFGCQLRWRLSRCRGR